MIKKESKFQSKELMQPSVHVQNLREQGIHKIILLNSHSNLTKNSLWAPLLIKLHYQPDPTEQKADPNKSLLSVYAQDLLQVCYGEPRAGPRLIQSTPRVGLNSRPQFQKQTLLKSDQMSVHIIWNIQGVGLEAVRKKMSLLHISPCKADHKSLKHVNLQQTQSRCKF